MSRRVESMTGVAIPMIGFTIAVVAFVLAMRGFVVCVGTVAVIMDRFLIHRAGRRAFIRIVKSMITYSRFLISLA
jgi:hypothetical protein